MMDQLITLEERTRPEGEGDALGTAIRKDLGNFYFGLILEEPVKEEEIRHEDSRFDDPPSKDINK